MINTTSNTNKKPEKSWVWTGSFFIQLENRPKKEDTQKKDPPKEIQKK